MTDRLTLVVDNDFTRGNAVYAAGIAKGRRKTRTEEARYHQCLGNQKEADRQREERDRIL